MVRVAQFRSLGWPNGSWRSMCATGGGYTSELKLTSPIVSAKPRSPCIQLSITVMLRLLFFQWHVSLSFTHSTSTNFTHLLIHSYLSSTPIILCFINNKLILLIIISFQLPTWLLSLLYSPLLTLICYILFIYLSGMGLSKLPITIRFPGLQHLQCVPSHTANKVSLMVNTIRYIANMLKQSNRKPKVTIDPLWGKSFRCIKPIVWPSCWDNNIFSLILTLLILLYLLLH